IGGMDSGAPAESGDLDAAIVGKRGKVRRPGGGVRLDPGVAFERLLRLFRRSEAEIAGGDRLDAVGREERADLPHLAGVMSGDDQPPRRQPPAHPIAAFCAAISSSTPFRARVSISMS